jgi:hypothetical protein
MTPAEKVTPAPRKRGAGVAVWRQIEEIARLDEVSAVQPIFPYTVLDDPGTRQRYTGGKVEQFNAPAGTIA